MISLADTLVLLTELQSYSTDFTVSVRVTHVLRDFSLSSAIYILKQPKVLKLQTKCFTTAFLVESFHVDAKVFVLSDSKLCNHVHIYSIS